MSAARRQSQQMKHNRINSVSSLSEQLKMILMVSRNCHENKINMILRVSADCKIQINSNNINIVGRLSQKLNCHDMKTFSSL